MALKFNNKIIEDFGLLVIWDRTNDDGVVRKKLYKIEQKGFEQPLQFSNNSFQWVLSKSKKKTQRSCKFLVDQ